MLKKYFVYIFTLLTTLFTACNDKFSDNPSYKLAFSADTVRFDTVFTTIGSTTARVMVYNPNKENLKIDQVMLGKGAESYFRINLDGYANAENTISNVEILKHDSLYLFIEVTIDPNNQNSPVLVNDYIQFSTNGNTQRIELEAYGQDIILFKQKLITQDTILTAEKPYLVYDYLAVDTARTLTIAAGCKFYFHDRAQFVVFGNLIAEGTLEKPITMRGDRLDYMFPHIPYNYSAGQWDGLYLIQVNNHATARHKLDYVETNSGTIGIYLSSDNKNITPNLRLENSRLHNFSTYGLVAQNANVEVINTEISNCASYCAYLAGGEHKFIHSTIANYFGNTNAISQPTKRDGERPHPAVYINDLSKTSAPMNSIFRNCIVTGSVKTEFEIGATFPERYHGEFSHCYFRGDSLKLPQFTDMAYCQAEDTVFVNTYVAYGDYNYYDFQLDSVSPARGIGDLETAAQYPFDRNGNNRLADGAPDAGAYEWQSQITEQPNE